MAEGSKPQCVAITGATGYIGGRLAPRLLDSGFRIRCLVRTPAKLRDREWDKDSRVEVRQTDLEDAESLARNLDGCQAAFYLVHSMNSAGAEYALQDRRLASIFASAARKAGIGRIIYLGGLGETGSDLSEHLSSRREVEKALASTGVPITVLRAAMIIGSGSASFEILRYLVERLPIMITPKWVSTPCQPIAVENVIEYLTGTLSRPEMAGGIFDIGGPDVMCYRDIMRIMAEELGLRRRWIIPVPVLTPRLSSYWIHLITPLSHNIAKPLAEGLKNPVVCRDKRITQLIPQQLLTVREAIQASLRQMTENQVETNWSMAGRMPGDPAWAVEGFFAMSAKSQSTRPTGPYSGPFAESAAGTDGTQRTGSGEFVVGSTCSSAAPDFAAAAGIRRRSVMAKRSTSGALSDWNVTAGWRSALK